MIEYSLILKFLDVQLLKLQISFYLEFVFYVLVQQKRSHLNIQILWKNGLLA